MEDIVKLLPDSVANQIAAGEVIQRPAAVVKELVENAVDAGATIIKINIKDAGRTLIQVIDNGCGMSPMDARMAFERHATSKIGNADDLFALHTMGFRGEALASICAVAEVELKTMRRSDQIGTRIVICGSKVELQEPAVTAPGSTMTVKRLFFNTPARRKFLKSDHVEMSNILREFERLALVNPGIELELSHNDVIVHQLLKSTFKQRIIDLFGKSLDRQLVPVVSDTSLVKINGFVSRPENARRRGALQYFMVNGRNMRHPYFHKAVMQCYEKLIPADAQPNYFINLHVDPETIDVNIHPTKNEIKFENEQAIWQILTAAIRDSLGRFNVGPVLDFDQEDAPEIPVFNPETERMPELVIDNEYNPFSEPVPLPSDILGPEFSRPVSHTARREASQSFRQSGRDVSTGSRASVATDWAKLYDDFMRKRDEGLAAAPETTAESSQPAPAPLPIEAGHTMHSHSEGNAYQYKDSYILTPSRDGLMIIDQHRAHLRVLYDSYIAKAGEQEYVAQATMFPDVLELSAAQSTVLADIRTRMSELGFVITPRGGNTWSIDGIPSQMADTPARDMVLAMIDNISSTGLDPASAMYEQFALSMARAGAIRRGQPLTADDIDRLLSDLFRSSSPSFTPDGKKIFAIISTDYITRLLG